MNGCAFEVAESDFLRLRGWKIMAQINAEEARNRLPDVQLVFDEGNYDHALQCYSAAQDWVLMSGQAFREDIYGVINHPYHPRCPVGDYNVPGELFEVEAWSLTVDIWCADDSALEWLCALPVPEGSRLINHESVDWPEEL